MNDRRTLTNVAKQRLREKTESINRRLLRDFDDAQNEIEERHRRERRRLQRDEPQERSE